MCFNFIEMDDNFDAPELMDDDNGVDDYNDGDDDGNNVAKEVEVKCPKINNLLTSCIVLILSLLHT